MSVACDKLKGRPREICQGFDSQGQPLDMLPTIRFKSLVALRSLLPGVTVEELAAHVHMDQTHHLPRRVLTDGGQSLATSLRHLELVGTALAARIEKLITIKTGEGCQCQTLAKDMDGWGIAGCERRREEIVNHLVQNRDILIDALKSQDSVVGKAVGFAAGLLPDSALQTGAGWLLDRAIEDVRAKIETDHQANLLKQKAERSIRATQRRGRAYIGWRSEADGPMISMGPFVSDVRHLTYFVYPRSLESWQWNLQQLALRWNLFNGTKILGLCHDAESAPPPEVIEYATSLGMVFDHVLTAKNNAKLREVVLFAPMLKLLRPDTAGDNEVVFTAHAKGQKYTDAAHTRHWTDLMYQSCLDHWPSVEVSLQTSLMAGSFREYGLLGKWHNWAYSGTFYWWRLQAIGKRKWYDVDQWFAGTESWPGKMCMPEEVSCLFLNDSRRLYDEHYWKTTVWPEWAKYLEARRTGVT